MNKLTRTFHAAGQGAFYTEEFADNKFTMVYDCGSYTGKNIIEQRIDEAELKKEIDLLVISHFHGDHINGLEYLLENYEIKHILLPFLHDEDKIDVYLYNKESSEFIQNICLKPKETISKKSQSTKVIFVNIYDSKANTDNNRESINLDSLDSSSSIESATSIKVADNWIYMPFNFEYKTRNTKLKNEFTTAGIPLNIDDFLKYYQMNSSNKDNVKNAYESIRGDMNTNSLVLYSGVEKSSMFGRSIQSMAYYPPYLEFCIEVGCLYMGDYCAKGARKMKKLEEAFSRYFNDVGTIQIPHHGSTQNYNSKLNFKKGLVSVISAGVGNKYKHPHGSTLKQIVLYGGIPVLVTEVIASKLVQHIIMV